MPAEPQDDQALPAPSHGGAVSSSTGPATPPADAPPPPPDRPSLEHVLSIVRYLRVHCPWDAAQTPRSLLPYLTEEAHEVAHHVEDGDDDALAPELGDLLLHVAFQMVLAEERGAFVAADVVRLLDDKMRRRHPHLFGLGGARDWEAIKAEERRDQADEADQAVASLLDGLAKGLDPLSRAQRIQDRVAAVGFDWPEAQAALDKVTEEVAEVRALLEVGGSGDALEDELGDLLFAAVNVTRLAGRHAALALSSANRKFDRRFRALESLARERGLDLEQAGLDEMEALWGEVKRRER